MLLLQHFCEKCRSANFGRQLALAVAVVANMSVCRVDACQSVGSDQLVSREHDTRAVMNESWLVCRSLGPRRRPGSTSVEPGRFGNPCTSRGLAECPPLFYPDRA